MIAVIRESRPVTNGPANLSALVIGLFLLASPLRADVFLRVNQVGYKTQDPKIAVAFSEVPLPDRFAVIGVDTDASVFEGRTLRLTGEHWGKFDHQAELDFTGVTRPGRYVLRLGAARSLPFAIGGHALDDLPDQSLEFMRQQRCGYNPWLRVKCHQFDGRTAYGPLPAGTEIDARGGWHDAGDLLKYHMTSGNATAQMLLAYELGRQHASRACASPTASTPRATLARMAGPTSSTKRAGASNGCSNFTLRPTSFTTRWLTTATISASDFHRTIPRTTAGAREAQRVVDCADGRPRACCDTRASRPAWRTSPADMPPPWRWPTPPGRASLASAHSPSAASRPVGRSTNSAALGRGRSRATRTRLLTVTKRRPGPTICSGARRSSFAHGERRYLDEARLTLQTSRQRDMDGSGTGEALPVLPLHERRPFPSV